MIRNRNQKAKKENIQPFPWSVSGAVRGDGGGRASCGAGNPVSNFSIGIIGTL